MGGGWREGGEDAARESTEGAKYGLWDHDGLEIGGGKEIESVKMIKNIPARIGEGAFRGGL